MGTPACAGWPHIVPGVLTLVDLFAGCGGMTRGFEDSGEFRSVFAVEFDRDAASTYAANFGDHVACGPIEDVAAFPAADVVIGGPPCQGFSPLNREAVGFERRGLWREYLRALEAIEPRAFVMENVPELLRSAEFAEFQKRAEALGFKVESAILNAADFGVPQRRRRAIVIGVREGSIPWPAPTHADPAASPSSLVAHRATNDEDLRLNPLPLVAHRATKGRGLPANPSSFVTQRVTKDYRLPPAPEGAEPWVTFREAVEGLALQPDGRRWHRARNPRPESVRRYKAVPRDGGDRFAMQRNLDRAGLGDLVPNCWRNKPTGTTDVFGRLWWDRPAITIRTEFYKPEKGRYLHPSAHRPITVREAARLMSFPDDFILPEDQSMSSIARQVGNAVPPLLARRIAEALAAALAEVTAPERIEASERPLGAVA
jgi:DNA (cytosine-5)-methyltransferase 1